LEQQYNQETRRGGESRVRWQLHDRLDVRHAVQPARGKRFRGGR
jgi:hypothetical protein